jgi:hypothetical protein
MSTRATRCDACNRRIRANQHELLLSDLRTGQQVGRYHAAGRCISRAYAYMRQPGAVLRLSVVHPLRCGPNQALCDAGYSEGAA